MRLCLTTLAWLLAGLLPGVAGPIDFTPIEETRTLEGAVFKQLRFAQDGHAVHYEPPRDWTYAGDGGEIRLRPSDISQAQVTVLQTPLPAPQTFDESTRKQLQASMLSRLPPDATDPVFVDEEMSPVRIHQQETYGVTLSYKILGQEFLVNALFANLGDTQLRFRTVARKADFEKVHRAFLGSLFSLVWE